MASDLNDTVFPEEDIDDDDETPEDEEDDDDVLDDDVLDDDETEPPPTVATPASAGSEAIGTALIPISVAAATADASPKPPRTEQIEEKKALDDSRRLFQRLWTDEDEIGLLQGFLEYTAQRGSSHHNDTALFYDQIKSKLQLGFNKNQLVEKLRRLKKKYRNVLNKINSGKEFSFKSPHDRETFEISRRIWSNAAPPVTAPPVTAPVEDDEEINPNSKTPLSRKRSRPRSEKRDLNDGSTLNRDNNCIGNNNNSNSNNNDNNNNENCNGRHNLQCLIEETVRSCVSPVLKELVCGTGGMGLGTGFASNPLQMPIPMPLNLLKLGIRETAMDERWRKQQVLELEVYSKRLELVQNEIKVALQELRSGGGDGG